MARLARVVVPGLPHHAVHRARPRAILFRDQTDYGRYRGLLLDNCARYEVELSAYCLMPDHVHVVVVPRTAAGLARAIGETGRLYARYRGLGGAKLWRGRFLSCPLDEEHARAAVAYVAGNPERAKLGPWQWCDPRPAPVPAMARQVDLIRKSTRSGRPAGGPPLYARLEYDIGRPLTPRKRGRKLKW